MLAGGGVHDDDTGGGVSLRATTGGQADSAGRDGGGALFAGTYWGAAY